MIDSNVIIKGWENRVGPETAHLQEGKNLKYENLKSMFSDAFKGVVTQDKRILDFGCGGGFLGKFLFESGYDPGHYSGLDIANRAVIVAKERLKIYIDLKKADVGLIDPCDFYYLEIGHSDIFACFNVIQHFPDIEYFDYFFDKINRSGIQTLILNYRRGTLEFSDTPYKTTHDINLACSCDTIDIASRLTNYRIKKMIQKKDNNFVTIEFKKVEKKVDKNDEKA